MEIATLITEINTITRDIKTAFSPFITVGRNIAGVGSLFWVSLKMWRIMATGEADGLATHMESLVRPCFLALLLIFYNTTLSLCDFLVSPIGASTQGWAISYMEKNDALEKQYKVDLEKAILDNQESEADKVKNADPNNPNDGAIDKEQGVMYEVKQAIAEGYENMVSTMKSIYYNVKLFTSVSWWIGMLVGILNTLINMALKISYLAHINDAEYQFSHFGGIRSSCHWSFYLHAFSDNWKNFYANYVGKLLWFPVANMCLAIAYRLKNISDENSYEVLIAFAKNTHLLGSMALGGVGAINSGLEAYDTIQTIDWTPVFLSIGVTIIGCFAVMKTPSLASLVISGASGGMTSSPISGSTFVAATSFMAIKSAQMLSKPLAEAVKVIQSGANKSSATSGNHNSNQGANPNSFVYGLGGSGQNAGNKASNQV